MYVTNERLPSMLCNVHVTQHIHSRVTPYIREVEHWKIFYTIECHHWLSIYRKFPSMVETHSPNCHALYYRGRPLQYTGWTIGRHEMLDSFFTTYQLKPSRNQRYRVLRVRWPTHKYNSVIIRKQGCHDSTKIEKKISYYLTFTATLIFWLLYSV